jgi:hypothetical protein
MATSPIQNDGSVTVWAPPAYNAELIIASAEIPTSGYQLRNPPGWFMDLHRRIESSYEHLHTLLSTSTVSPHQLGKLEKQYQDLFNHYDRVTSMLGSGVELTAAFTKELEQRLEMSCQTFGQTVNTQLAAHARDDADRKRAIDALTRETQR